MSSTKMNKIIALLTILIPVVFFATSLVAQPAPEEILDRIDGNMTIKSARTSARMIITYREGDERELAFESWAEGTDQSFLEFTAPARDAGSRFLRMEDRMWIYLPRAGKSVRIQGHMLRQGLMGSDFSYGDASERPSMKDDYEAVLETQEEFEGRPCFVLYLTAKRDNLAYPMRRIWVDSERFVPLKEERFAKSGKLLKTSTMGDVRRVGNRWYPFSISLDNALQADTRTTLEFVELEFDVDVPEEFFTLRHLEGG